MHSTTSGSAGKKRTRTADTAESIDTAHMPGSFPERLSGPKRRPSPESNKDWFSKYFMQPFVTAKNWITGTPQQKPSKLRLTPSSSEWTVESRGPEPLPQNHYQRKRRHHRAFNGGATSHRRPLVPGKVRSGKLRRERSSDLVREYTEPRVSQVQIQSQDWATTMPRISLGGKPQVLGRASQTYSVSSSFSRETDDQQSIISIDSSTPEYESSFGVGTSAAETTRRISLDTRKAAQAQEEQWIVRLRKKIEETLSVAAPATRISTPAYDRVCKADGAFEKRLARARQRSVAFVLPANAAQVIDRAMQPGFTCELNNTPVTARDLQTLMPGKWLNDEVINFYMQLIMGRSANAGGGKAASLPKVHAFNTFFFSTLRENGYARVKRWTRRIDVFAMDLVVVPVHLGVHWCCAIVDFGQRSIRYYDALLGENTECLELLMEYLRLESRDKRGGRVFDEQGWVMTCEKDIPRQQNGYDCGVFAVAFAEHIARGAELDFAQENCAFLRRKMIYEIATKALLH